MSSTPKVGFLAITWPGLYTASSETGEAWIQSEDTQIALKALQATPVEVIAHPRVVSQIDESLQAVEHFLDEDVDCLVLFVQTWNWADRILQAAQRFGRPILLWALPIPRLWSIGGLSVTHGSLDEVGIPHQVVYGMPDEPGIMESILRFARAAHVKNALRKARFGSVGGHGMGIYTGPVDPSQWMNEFGLTVGFIDQYEVVAEGEKVTAEELGAYYQTLCQEYGSVPPYDQVTERSIRLYLGMERIIAREKFDFTGVNDMFGLSDNYCSMCLAQSRLSSRGYVTTCLNDFERCPDRLHLAPAQRAAALHRGRQPGGQKYRHRAPDRRRSRGDHPGPEPQGCQAELPAAPGVQSQRRLYRAGVQAGEDHTGAALTGTGRLRDADRRGRGNRGRASLAGGMRLPDVAARLPEAGRRPGILRAEPAL